MSNLTTECHNNFKMRFWYLSNLIDETVLHVVKFVFCYSDNYSTVVGLCPSRRGVKFCVLCNMSYKS